MLESYHAEHSDFQRLVAAVRRIQSASVEELRSLEWLVTVIREVGLVPIPEAERTYADEAEYLNSSNQGVIQIPREFGRYLLLLGELRPVTYLEVGTFNGATACLAAAFLRRFHPEFRAVTIDIYPHFLFAREIQPLLPWLEYRVPCTSFEVGKEKFEAVFIDGDHSFEWAWADYQNVGLTARMCAFHDVNNAPYREMDLGGVPAVWELLRQTEKDAVFHEFLEHPNEDLLGIGVLVRSEFRN